MKRFGWLISRYLLQAVLPYFIFTWLLLSVILFVQQASRFSDIFFSVNLPSSLVWQLTFALAPNVIAFTCPMAVLIGVIIGLARMQGDSELTAVRSAGVGNFQIAIPIVFLGILLSIFAFFINLKGVPLAAQIVRKVAVQSAIKKLESPIEPGVFNTEINGFTIYVKNVDFEKGTWKNIFIYTEDLQTNETRLITSKNGRIDFNDENNELVLEDAIITTFPGQTEKNEQIKRAKKAEKKYVSESVGNIRFAINTKRSELIEKINRGEITAEEMGLSELAQFARTKQGIERIEAEVLWQRRVMLSITPLLFALLGIALNLRFNRGGRGFGIFLALVSLVVYYLLALFGEQMARTEKLSPFAGSLLPVVVSGSLIGWLFLSSRAFSSVPLNNFKKKINFDFGKRFSLNKPGKSGKNFFIGLLYGILDFDIISSLLKYLLLTLGFLSSIYIIFTAFELWKFAGTIDNGFVLLIKYLVFLIPFIYIQLVPSAVMIAILATYVIKSRRNEIVTWTAAGQSIYRLLFPCFLLMGCLGIINWQIQERILPETNQIQDVLRNQMRNRGITAKKEGKYWVATDERIYSFQIEENAVFDSQTIKNLSVYDFSPNELRLQTVYRIPEAFWNFDRIIFKSEAVKSSLMDGQIAIEIVPNGELTEKNNPFNELTKKPNHLNASETFEQMKNTESETERRTYAVALEKKFTTGVLPFIITLFTAPFALSLSRRGKVATVGYAVAVWLVFMGYTSYFEQFGLSGYLSPAMAVWSPLFLFTIFGIYMMSKVKT
jgi:LPS export ABC transporter permease LptF